MTNLTMNKLNVYFLQMPTYEKRVEIFEDKEYIVVPVVMMVEGVHNGSEGPVFHSKEELGTMVEAWNGSPLVVDHPQDADGGNISANSPEVLTASGVGYVFNTQMKGNKLTAEAWIDSAKIAVVSPTANQMLAEGAVMEVSIGAFYDTEAATGTWEDVPYSGIAANIRPDHLALLPEATGACSVGDGCGIRTNKNKNKKGEENAMKLNVNHIMEGLITSPDSDTIHKLSKQGLNFSGLVVSEQSLTELIDRMYAMVNGMDSDTAYYYLQELFKDFVIYRKRIRNTNDGNNSSYWKQVYQVAADDSIQWVGAPIQVVRNVTYSPVPVPEVQISKSRRTKPPTKKEDKTMTTNECPKCVKLVNALISNKESSWTEDDREVLSTMSESQLDKMAPKEVEEVKEIVVNKEKDITTLSEADQEAAAYKVLGIENPAEFKAQTAHGLAVFQEQVKKTVAHIMTYTAKDTWTEDMLNEMDFKTLQRIAVSVTPKKKEGENPYDYSMQGVGKAPVVNQGEPTVEPMMGTQMAAKPIESRKEETK